MRILEAIRIVLSELPPRLSPYGITSRDAFRFAIQAQVPLVEDEQRYKDDPTIGDGGTVDGVIGGFLAVAFHRVAAEIQRYGDENGIEGCSILARMLSERGKARTGVEIHPAADIGPGFAVDHGFGTVIGATVSAGKRLYMLHNVTLGAVGVAGNTAGKRHPQLGDDVSIGANSSIFGPVKIGNGADIRSGCMVIHDVPAGAVVSQQLAYQVTYLPRAPQGPEHGPAEFPEIFGMIPIQATDWTGMRIYGHKLVAVSAALVDAEGKVVAGQGNLKVVPGPDGSIEVHLAGLGALPVKPDKRFGLKLEQPDGSMMILNGKGLWRVLITLKGPSINPEGNE